ncbi:MAG: DUF4129 domain-containing protein [Candidatus Binatia bacterium]
MYMITKPGNKALTICFALLVSLVCFTRISAATFAEYRHRVSEAVAAIAQLQATYENEDPSLRERSVRANVDRLVELLPAKETVLLDGQSVTTDNTWLDEALRDYQKANKTEAERVETRARIEERLRAIDERLDEMQRAQPASTNDKDSNKGRLAEILRRPDYNKPAAAAEGNALARLWSRFLRWLFSLFPKTKPITPSDSPFISGLAQILVVAVALGGIAFLVWKLAPRYLSNRRSRKKQKREARIVLGERLEPDQTAADLLAQAESLARSGDLRGAIRKAYIALLCELGDRKIVSLAQHKTNLDYLNSVRDRVHLYSSMRQLTNSFELHWYGFQPPAENDWNEFRSGYQKALRIGSGQ